MTGSEDPDALRAAMLDGCERSAPAWVARRYRVRAFGMPVPRWLIDAVSPQLGVVGRRREARQPDLVLYRTPGG